jgi:hypothetical protein
MWDLRVNTDTPVSEVTVQVFVEFLFPGWELEGPNVFVDGEHVRADGLHTMRA